MSQLSLNQDAYTIMITGQTNPPYASRETQIYTVSASSTQEAKEIAKSKFKQNYQNAAGIYAQIKNI